MGGAMVGRFKLSKPMGRSKSMFGIGPRCPWMESTEQVNDFDEF
jgi:hypothetical protein